MGDRNNRIYSLHKFFLLRHRKIVVLCFSCAFLYSLSFEFVVIFNMSVQVLYHLRCKKHHCEWVGQDLPVCECPTGDDFYNERASACDPLSQVTGRLLYKSRRYTCTVCMVRELREQTGIVSASPILVHPSALFVGSCLSTIMMFRYLHHRTGGRILLKKIYPRYRKLQFEIIATNHT